MEKNEEEDDICQHWLWGTDLEHRRLALLEEFDESRHHLRIDDLLNGRIALDREQLAEVRHGLNLRGLLIAHHHLHELRDLLQLLHQIRLLLLIGGGELSCGEVGRRLHRCGEVATFGHGLLALILAQLDDIILSLLSRLCLRDGLLDVPVDLRSRCAERHGARGGG